MERAGDHEDTVVFRAIGRFFKKVGIAIGHRELNTAIGIDKTIASQVLGTPQDETISGWSGLNEKTDPVADGLAKTLDAVHFAGDPHHAEDAGKEDLTIIQDRTAYDASKTNGS